MNTIRSSEGAEREVFKTLTVRKEGAVLFAEIAAPPMNLGARVSPQSGFPHSTGRSRRTAAADSLKVLDPKQPIREADIDGAHGGNVRFVP